MTNIAVTIGGHTVTGDVQYMMFQAEDLSSVRTCEIIILNEDNEWNNDFDIKDAIDVNIDSAQFWDGYVDDVEVYKHPDFVDLPMLRIRGLDYGSDLIKLYIDKDYKEDKIDNTIDDALSTASSEITYTTGNAAPLNSIDFKRKYLGDGIRELCQEANWTFYVDSSKTLHLFPIGAASEYLDGGGGRADVDLDSIAGSLTNNILDWKEGEQFGSKLWNHIEVTAGFVHDHWTDENAPDFTEVVNVTITNESTFGPDTPIGDWPPTFWSGRSSIKMTANSNGTIRGDLDFSGTRYEYSTLELTENTVMSYLLFCGFDSSHPDPQPRAVRLRLEDEDGKTIEFVKHLTDAGDGTKTDRTDNLTKGNWYKCTIPIGQVQEIKTFGGGVAVAGWRYITADTDFNWGAVDKLIWRTPYPILSGGHFIIDDLVIPTVDAKSIDFDQTSINAYGKRMLPIQRHDIISQKELDTLSESLLDKHKDPPVSLDLLVIGNTDIKFTGQSLDVNAPPYGVVGDTKYRIQFIQHKITLKGQGPVGDYEYTTRVRLLTEAELVSAGQFIDPGTSAIIKIYRDLDALQAWWELNSNLITWFGAQDTGSGDAFPEFPSPGQTWTLTEVSGSNNPGEYAYISDLNIPIAGAYTGANIQSDGGAGKGTITRLGGGTPYSGLSVGDFITTTQCENQENNLLYEIDSVTGTLITVTSLIDTTNTNDTSIIIDRFMWVITGVTYIVDTVDFSTIEWPTDQMAIEVRPWTANFSIIWDDKDDTPPTDWNHFKWGSLGNENSADATITYADATSVDVNFGQDTNLGNGAWWVYWDTAQKTGGDYDVQFTQTYSTASGAGKGVLAQVFVDNAGSNAPDILMYNSYAPTIGTGSLVAYAIQSKHISADFITGKNFQSVSGTTSVTFTSAGIIGKNSGVTQFSLSAVDGTATAGAGRVILDENGITIQNDHTILDANLEFQNLAGDSFGKIFSFDATIGGGGGAFDGLTLRNASNKDIILLATNGTTGKIALQADDDIFMYASANAVLKADVDVGLLSGRDITLGADDDIILSANDNIDFLTTTGFINIDPATFVILDTPAGAGNGIHLKAGSSFVKVGLGNTDVDIHADDDILLDADDDIVMIADGFFTATGQGGMLLATATGALSLSSNVAMLLAATGGITVNAGVTNVDDILMTCGDDFRVEADDNITLSALDNIYLMVGGTDNVGIDTTTPSQILDISQGRGNMIVDGYDTHSLASYKMNIEEVEDGYLDKLSSVSLHKYNRVPHVGADEIKEACIAEFGEKRWYRLYPPHAGDETGRHTHRGGKLRDCPDAEVLIFIDNFADNLRETRCKEPKWKKDYLGLIADDPTLMDILPEVVAINPDGSPKGIDLVNYVGFLHGALRELADEVRKLKNEL